MERDNVVEDIDDGDDDDADDEEVVMGDGRTSSGKMARPSTMSVTYARRLPFVEATASVPRICRTTLLICRITL